VSDGVAFNGLFVPDHVATPRAWTSSRSREEVLLQTAVYCGVPAANTAFAVAARVLDEKEES
jgi:hypothetical protein